MKISQVSHTLKSLGWNTISDETGDRVANFALPDRIVEIIYSVEKFSNAQKLASTLSLSTEAFSLACSRVCGEPRDLATLVAAWKGLDIRVPKILEEHVREGAEFAIAWALEQDIDKALQACADLPTNVAGNLPIKHLAALALLGDLEKLKFYQASFETGNRLNFAAFVNPGMINRAIALAQNLAQNQAQKLAIKS